MFCCMRPFVSIAELENYDDFLIFKKLDEITYDVRDGAVHLIELDIATVFSCLKSQHLDFFGYNLEKLSMTYLKLNLGSYNCPLFTYSESQLGDINLDFQDGRHNVLALMKVYSNISKVVCSIIPKNNIGGQDLANKIGNKYGYAKLIKNK